MADIAEPLVNGAAPQTQNEQCECGSGLRATGCCGLDFRNLKRQDLGLFAERAGRMVLAYNDGEAELAERLALEVLAEAPGHKEALATLYNLRRDQKNFKVAEVLVRRIAMLEPNDPTAQAVAAQYMISIGNHAGAMPFGRQLVRLAPQAPIAHVTMGRIFNAQNQPKAAESHFGQAARYSETSETEIQLGLAVALKGQGRYAEAREGFAKVLEQGEDLQVLLEAATLEEADNKLVAAEGLLDRAAKIAPNGPRVALGRATLHRRAKRLDLALAELEGLDARLEDRGLSAFATLEKGKVLDALGRYDEAFAAFAAYKSRVRENSGNVYQEAAATQLVSHLTNFFTEGRSKLMPRAGKRADSPQPIFVVGFPRSGTTLVEQTLASHSSIAGGDELQIINQLVTRMQVTLGSPMPYPNALGELWMGDRVGQIETLRDHYLNEAARVGAMDPSKPWFTDKMPLNETHLGLISLLFPESPIIHLLRHPLDVVLSAFTNGLTHGFNCASALDTAARHYALIAELIQKYLAAMPFRYMAVRYEDLVVNQEAEVRALFAFIGEAFEPSVLAFHENTRPARTASYAQVTEKLYQSSRYRYRNYIHHLQPVIPVLEPAIRQLGYTVDV